MSAGFPSYMKRKLFSELRDRVDAGTRCPSLAWIVKFCKLSDVAQAERLLREMDRDGLIAVVRCGPYPWVSVLRDTYSGVKLTGRHLDPERFDQFTDGNDVLVVKAAPDPRALPKAGGQFEEFVDEDEEPPVPRIARPTRLAPPEPEIEMPSRPQPETVVALPGDDQGAQPALPPAQVAETVLDRVPDQPQLVEAQHISDEHEVDQSAPRVAVPSAAPEPKEAAVQPATSQPVEARQPEPKVPVVHSAPANALRFNGARSGQINIRPPADVWDNVVAEAKARNLPITTVAREIFMRAFDAPAAAPQPKPRIPAAFMTALRHDGRPFNQFHDDILALGLEAYLTFRSAE